MRLIFTIVLFAMLLVGRFLSAAEITVSAAASLQEAIAEVARKFERESGDRVTLNFAGSNVLARQIEAGAPVDVFVSADEETMDGLAAKGLLVAGSRRALVSNRLVIIIPADRKLNLLWPRDLAAGVIERIALADPRAVPAGRYAKEFLARAELWNAVQDKIIPLGNVRAALAAVGSGNADAGLVYRTDAALDRRVRVVCELPPPPAISYPVAIVAEAPSLDGARRFAAWLGSDAARQIFRKFGFVSVQP